MLLLSNISASAYIFTANNKVISTELMQEDTIQSIESSEAKIIGELKQERTQYSKTFKLNNGTNMVAKYPTPIHYKNKNGDWIDYDNSLTATEKEVTVFDVQSSIIDEAGHTSNKKIISNNTNKKVITNATKYYFSQTKTLFYGPLRKESSINLASNIFSSILSRFLRR